MNRVAHKFQQGMSLSKLIMVLVVVGAVSTLAMKLAPEYIEYWKLKADISAIAQEANANPNATVGDVRHAFERRAEIDQIRDISPADLDISKDAGKIVVALSYERKIHLFKNISVVVDFEISSDQ